MNTYVNSDYQRRVWPTLQHPDGTTLGLEPGETADLDLPDDFSDPYLVRADGTPPAPAVTNPPADVVVTDTPASGAGGDTSAYATAGGAPDSTTPDSSAPKE